MNFTISLITCKFSQNYNFKIFGFRTFPSYETVCSITSKLPESNVKSCYEYYLKFTSFHSIKKTFNVKKFILNSTKKILIIY